MRTLLRTVTGSARPSSSSPASTPNLSTLTKAWTSLDTALDNVAANGNGGSSKDGRERKPVDIRDIENWLNAIQSALAAEAARMTSSENDTGPCLEYVLTNDILHALVAYSATDNPPGLRGLVITLFDALVLLLGDDFVAFAHRPLLRLLEGDAGKRGSSGNNGQDVSQETGAAYGLEMASLLCAVCSRIKAHPDLLPIFFHDKAALRSSDSISQTTSPPPYIMDPTPSHTLKTRAAALPLIGSPTASTLSGRTSATSASSSAYSFPLLTHLLQYLHLPTKTGEFARAGLLFILDTAFTASPSAPAASQAAFHKTRRATRSGSRGHRSISVLRRTSSISGPMAKATAGRDQAIRMALADFLENKSGMADIIAAGLGATHGLLPTKLLIPSTSSTLGSAGAALHAGPADIAQAEEGGEKKDSHAIWRDRGYSFSTDQEVQEQMEAFGRLWEFAQDVIRRLSAAKPHAHLMADSPPKVEIIMRRRLLEKILAAIRTTFLENTLYPSILESLTYPSQSPATFYYLDSLLSILDPELPLADVVLRFLLGYLPAASSFENNNANVSHESAKPPLSPTLSVPMSARTFSGNSALKNEGLLQLDGQANAAPPILRRGISDNLSTFGTSAPARAPLKSPDVPETTTAEEAECPLVLDSERVSLREVLVGQLKARPDSDHDDAGSPSCLPALQLVRTIVSRFDVWSLELLDAFPHLGATLFPYEVPLEAVQELDSSAKDADKAGEGGDDGEEDFVYPSSDLDQEDNASDAQSFVYPSGPAGAPILSPSGSKKPAFGSGLDDGPSELELLLSLMPSAAASALADEGNPSGYMAYVRDAELAIMDDLSFKRGCTLAYREEESEAGVAHVGDSSIATMQTSSTDNTGGTAERSSSVVNATGKACSVDPMLQHRLSTDSSSVLTQLLSLLARYFAHSPEQNLALTGVMSRLALCPYRSLESWLLPSSASETKDGGKGGTGTARPLRKLKQLGLLELASAKDIGSGKEEQLEGSGVKKLQSFQDWQALFSPIQQVANGTSSSFVPFFTPDQPGTSTPQKKSKSTDNAVEAAVFNILAALLSQLSGFRQQVKGFDRYLQERRKGLSFVDELAEALEGTGSERAASSAILGLPSRASPAIVEPRTLKKVSPPSAPSWFSVATGGSAASTPMRARGKKDSGGGGGEEAVQSPYVAHYQQTEKIQVRVSVVPIPIISIPLLSKASHSPSAAYQLAPDTPTKPAIKAYPSTLGSPVPQGQRKEETTEGTLSDLLDNIIILQEAVKELVAIVCVRKSLGIDRV